MEKSYNALIVDDSPSDVAILTEHISKANISFTPYTTDQVTAAYQVLNSQPIDLIFLDMDINGASGFDLLALLPSHPPIIVISAHPAYAVDCFDLDIVDFIQKPYTSSRLYRAIGRALTPGQVPSSATAVPTLLTKPARETIYLKAGRKTERFFLDEIQLIEAYGIYSKLHLTHTMYVVNEKISQLESLLPTNQFIRIHKSFIINAAYITGVEPKAVYLDKTRLIIGVTFRDHVHSQLKQLGVEQ
jgi:two-component system response regulator LytT